MFLSSRAESRTHAGTVRVCVRPPATAREVSVVTVRLWAGVADAMGHPHGTEVSYAAESLEELLAHMRSAHGTLFAQVLPMCSVLIDGASVSRSADATTVALPEGATVDLLPPFAGG